MLRAVLFRKTTRSSVLSRSEPFQYSIEKTQKFKRRIGRKNTESVEAHGEGWMI